MKNRVDTLILMVAGLNRYSELFMLVTSTVVPSCCALIHGIVIRCSIMGFNLGIAPDRKIVLKVRVGIDLPDIENLQPESRACPRCHLKEELL